MGIRARQMAEGRWVNTIVCSGGWVSQGWVVKGLGRKRKGREGSVSVRVSVTLTLPILLEMEDATSIERAEMTPVTEKIDPSLPSDKLNRRLK
jgi:hypothetical protein